MSTPAGALLAAWYAVGVECGTGLGRRVRHHRAGGPDAGRAELLAASDAFARLWNSHELRIEHHEHQVVRHPTVGSIALAFDVLTVPGQDQQLVIFTAEPGSRRTRRSSY
jgi:hypothetical protein